MVDITEDELVVVENALQEVLNGLDDSTPEAQMMKQQIVEAQQIISAKIEGSASGKDMVGEAGPSGPGV